MSSSGCVGDKYTPWRVCRTVSRSSLPPCCTLLPVTAQVPRCSHSARTLSTSRTDTHTSPPTQTKPADACKGAEARNPRLCNACATRVQRPLLCIHQSWSACINHRALRQRPPVADLVLFGCAKDLLAHPLLSAHTMSHGGAHGAGRGDAAGRHVEVQITRPVSVTVPLRAVAQI